MLHPRLHHALRAAIELRPRSVLRYVARVFRAKWHRVVGTAALVFGLSGVANVGITVGGDAAQRTDPWLAAVVLAATAVSTLGTTFYAGLLDRLVESSILEEPDEMFRHVFRTLPYTRLILADLLLSLVVVAGAAFLLVPGLILLTLFCVVGPVINIERRTVVSAFARSARLVRPHFWLVFVLVTVPLVVEHELVNALTELGHERSVLVVFLAHGLLGMVVGAAVALIEVVLAYGLIVDDAVRHPASV